MENTANMGKRKFKDYEVCNSCSNLILDSRYEDHPKHCPNSKRLHKHGQKDIRLAEWCNHIYQCDDNLPHDKRRREALLVGAAVARNQTLNTPVNDIKKLAAVLRQLGFNTRTLENPSKIDIETVKQSFLGDIEADTIAFFHFSGHGGTASNQLKNRLLLHDTLTMDAQKLVKDLSDRNPLFFISSLNLCKQDEHDIFTIQGRPKSLLMTAMSNAMTFEAPNQKC